MSCIGRSLFCILRSLHCDLQSFIYDLNYPWCLALESVGLRKLPRSHSLVFGLLLSSSLGGLAGLLLV